jgi:hypothetical protein
MSLIPCSVCAERTPEKLASVTWAWWSSDSERVAVRQKLCTACYCATALVLTAAVQTNPYDCPVCHRDATSAMSPVYMTAFLPGVGRVRAEMASCTDCATEIRERALVGAVKLEDRADQSLGQDSGPTTDPALDAWKALGILPRE